MAYIKDADVRIIDRHIMACEQMICELEYAVIYLNEQYEFSSTYNDDIHEGYRDLIARADKVWNREDVEREA